MKETKRFFDISNTLNKGYTNTASIKQVNSYTTSNNLYKHILPPLDIMAAYEEVSPGSINKIIEMAQKEQEYLHCLEKESVQKYNRLTKLGKICGVIFIGIIAITTLILSFSGYYITASIFSLSAFSTIGISSLVGFSNKQKGEYLNNRTKVGSSQQCIPKKNTQVHMK